MATQIRGPRLFYKRRSEGSAENWADSSTNGQIFQIGQYLKKSSDILLLIVRNQKKTHAQQIRDITL